MTVQDLKDIKGIGIDNSKILENELMSKHTSFKIGGPAQCYIKIHNIEDLIQALSFANDRKIPVTIIGNGSNLLVRDKGINGIVLKIDLKNIEINNSEIIVGSGYKIPMLAQKLLQNELTGFEELSGIPGTVGGAITMNAGAHKKEFKDIVESVKCVNYTGNLKELKKDELQFGYRTSIFKKEKYIIVEAKLKFKKGKVYEIEEKMKEYAKYRKEKQPIEYPSAGSTFKRGDDYITAKLIEDAGLKGYEIGGAKVSTKHSGFVINQGNATAQDVINLTDYIKKEILKKFNKKIELEIEIIGEK